MQPVDYAIKPGPQGLYHHIISFLLINTVLIILNLMLDPNQLWSQWTFIGWGLCLLTQALRTFSLCSFLF